MANIFSRFSKSNKRKDISLDESIDKIQSGDMDLRNQVIKDYTPFVASAVSSVCQRYITESDDEFSIGLIAFNESLDKFAPGKGKSVIAFSETVIKNRVVDYIRKESSSTDLFNHSTLQMDNDEEGNSNARDSVDISAYQEELTNNNRQDEILKFQDKLAEFNLTMKELMNQAPKHIDARINAIKVAELLIQNKDLRDIFYDTKKIPMKDLLKLEDLPVTRKTVERNRKYIISLAIILDNNFVFLKDYLRLEE
ncbi:RNA polymerase sigma-I factor [Priestia sp. SB1]|uniref:RNA polymerase sigma-I factor n=1 Tax=Priestia sp. SB1 TaxID=3132359 RepID=UPI00317A8F90